MILIVDSTCPCNLDFSKVHFIKLKGQEDWDLSLTLLMPLQLELFLREKWGFLCRGKRSAEILFGFCPEEH